MIVMNCIDELIRYENENSSLDFKVVQYTKDKHEDLIKDILSMANANVEGEKYIIVGVKHKTSNDRDIIGIKKEDFSDSATYQQLIRENIEPDILIEYSPYEIDGKYVGIFRIKEANNKPYMMKKDFGKKLKKGDCFIRKGVFKLR